MRTSVILNNYNYGHFAVEAIASALNQTVPPDEIIVVDDGSTDDSAARLTATFAHEPRVRILTQANGGMLSTHNRGFAESTGDILFFLDADDLYEPRRIGAALEVFQGQPQVGLVFSPMRLFGSAEGFMFVWKNRENWSNAPKEQPPPNQDIAFGSVLPDAYLLHRFIGGATSSLAIRRSVLEQFMPLDFEKEWRNHSDNCLLYGAAMTGTHVFYLAQPLIRYRAHACNDFCGRQQSELKQKELQRRNGRLIDHLAEKLRVPRRSDPAILGAVAQKLAAAAAPWNEYNRYARRLRSFGMSPAVALRWRMKLLASFLKGRL